MSELSKCCNAKVKIGGEGLTHFYVCTKCNEACDYFNIDEREKLIEELNDIRLADFDCVWNTAEIADFIINDRKRIVNSVEKILEGIDKDQCDSDKGFWETSDGVKAGKQMLIEIRKLAGVNHGE